jgi:hypothetical protein
VAAIGGMKRNGGGEKSMAAARRKYRISKLK